jgi:mannose/cellobiose epimerase-like protein (N-acyl-D-glucosamine 2-epimerase family)
MWTAEERNKENFDNALNFIEEKMLHPQEGYIMWRLEHDDTIVTDGANLASDADLRAISALIIAEQQWGDEKYSNRIDLLAQTLERMTITQNKLFAPYAGVSGNEIWKTEEVWLSYTDFSVFRELANRRGQPWLSVYNNMKKEVLRSQIHNGLYNAGIDKEGKIINLDVDQYSVNSLWVMVRSAESGDVDLRKSADKALLFYKNSYQRDGIIYTGYRSDGSPASDQDSPWVYALVGRAAVALGDEDFAADIMKELGKKQIKDQTSEYYGAFPESAEGGKRVGQFTMQESIITIQDFEKRFLVENR